MYLTLKKHCKLHFFLAPFENFLLKNFPLNGKIELSRYLKQNNKHFKPSTNQMQQQQQFTKKCSRMQQQNKNKKKERKTKCNSRIN